MKPYIHTAPSAGPGTRRLFTSLFVAGLLAATASSVFAQGGVVTPIHVGAMEPIKDEFGTNLHGSALSNPDDCDIVQVLWASNSVINPPAYDGTPDSENPPVEGGLSRIGNLTATMLSEPGFFSVAIGDPRPVTGRMFVRVFNAPNLDDASFYSDSQVLTISGNNSLIAEFGSTTNPLDPRDFDDDGLHNSWEKSLDLDPDNPDTDGDGMIDGWEFRAGTDGKDDKSVFVAVHIAAASSTDALLSWATVVGKQYQVEYMDITDAGPLCYSNVSAVITADSEATITTITNGLSGGTGKYRVRLVE